jgi:hypothetical protein
LTPKRAAAIAAIGARKIERRQVERRVAGDETTRLVNILSADRDRWKAACASNVTKVIALEVECDRLRMVNSQLLRQLDESEPSQGEVSP